MTRVFLDVSDLPAPEPLEAGLNGAWHLEKGSYLHFHHRQFPRLLFQPLDKGGFDFEVREGTKGGCEVFIWKKGDELALREARAAADSYALWVKADG